MVRTALDASPSKVGGKAGRKARKGSAPLPLAADDYDDDYDTVANTASQGDMLAHIIAKAGGFNRIVGLIVVTAVLLYMGRVLEAVSEQKIGRAHV